MIFLIHYLAAWNYNCSKFCGEIKEKYFICCLIINKPQPNLNLGDTFLGPEGVS